MRDFTAERNILEIQDGITGDARDIHFFMNNLRNGGEVMRDFAAERNILEIQDGITGDVHEIHYRMPTNEERAAYQNGVFERRGQKIKSRIFENRLKFGARIITGFAGRTLGIDGRAMSADPGNPDYRQDWKDLLVRHAGDIVASVAASVFEATGTAREAEPEGPLDE